jgi:beta-glucosidase/6-phospho-beta-glucosidase/beta-galactosidase
MISQSLIELIEKNAEKLAKQWVKDVTENVQTPFYHTYNQDHLYERGLNMYKRLGHWLSIQTPKEETAKFFKKYGQDRFREGFPLPELIYSFILFRRHLWLYILHVGFLDSAYELRRALELNNRVILFFDRALHNIALGYEESKKKKE